MKPRIFILTLFFFPTLLFGQKKYRFRYSEHLTGQLSTFTSQSKDTVLEADMCNLTFLILDKSEQSIPFADIRIIKSIKDTILHTDANGLLTITLPSEIFNIIISNFQFTGIRLDGLATKSNSKTTIKTSLGQSNILKIATIYSVKKLSKKEIKSIIHDISNDIENELIKTKTCYVMWQI